MSKKVADFGSMRTRKISFSKKLFPNDVSNLDKNELEYVRKHNTGKKEIKMIVLRGKIFDFIYKFVKNDKNCYLLPRILFGAKLS